MKYLHAYPTTNCIELTTDVPYTLCQKVQLNAGRKYKIQYSLFCLAFFKSTILTAHLNNINISSLTILGPNKFGNQTTYFIANSSGQNELCFNEVNQLFPVYPSTFTYIYGGLLDNISLVEGNFFSINFEATI
jgi:hypothetical protein